MYRHDNFFYAKDLELQREADRLEEEARRYAKADWKDGGDCRSTEL